VGGHIIRNLLKNYSFPLNIFILFILLSLHMGEMIVLTLLCKFKAVKCYINAYEWNIRNISDTLKYRKLVQSKRKVSDFTLMKRMYLAYSKLTAFVRLGFPTFR